MEQHQEPLLKQKSSGSIDKIFAILSILFAFLFLKYTFAVTPGIALTVVTVLFVTTVLLYGILRKKKLPAASYLWGGILVFFSLTYSITANPFLKGWCIVFELLATAYFIFLTFSNRTAKYPDDMLGFDLLKSIFILPFGNCHQLFITTSYREKEKKSSYHVLYIFLGLCLALVPSVLVFILLISGDTMFANLVDYLFSDFGDLFGNNIGCLLFTLPFAMLIFGLLYGSAEQKFTTVLSRQKKERFTKAFQFAPSSMVCAALTPMLLIYLLYFISQTGYYWDAFSNLKPEGYSYAEYAREGFFQLCAVCAINTVVILTVHFFTKRTEKKTYSPAAKVFVILFSFSSILLAVTALQKTFLYIHQYGLTPLRVYAPWFMILLSVCFLVLIVKQFIKKLNATFCTLIAFLILFGGLCLINVDARIAEYNINRHIQSLNEETTVALDLDMFYQDLSPAAIIAVHEAYDNLDEETQKEADSYFKECAIQMVERNRDSDRWDKREYSFRSWNSDTYRAFKILQQRCPQQFSSLPHPFGWTW